MSAIVRYGACLPRHRLAAASAGRPGKAVRTVAGADEDALTLAVAAARNALGACDRSQIDGLIFASTSAAYGEKQSAAIAARALGLNAELLAFDLGGSTRAGTQALLTAAALVDSGRVRHCLVLCGDVRELAPGDAAELNFGDAGAALLLGTEGFASFGKVVQRSNEMLDVWRAANERFVHSWENRFIMDHGYKDQLAAVLTELGEQDEEGGLGQASHYAIYAPDVRSLKEVAAQAGLAADRLLGLSTLGQIGCSGAADALLQLCMALDRAEAGERVLLANYGDGADAAWITVSDRPTAPRRSVAEQLRQGRQIDYHWYLQARKMLAAEFPSGGELGNSATAHFRERDANLALEGQVCECGTHQFPKGRVCVRCGALDRFQPRRYAECSGRVVTYSHDYFFPNPSPPTVITVTEVAGGPRIYLQVADAEKEQIEPGTAVDFVFRRIHQVGNRPNYFWKCIPQDDGEAR